ncbi:GrpB family protein [Streptomyces sp. ME19-01-6]
MAEQLSDALGDLPVAIDHVGSTSVPGLPANRPRWNGMGGLRVCSNTS